MFARHYVLQQHSVQPGFGAVRSRAIRVTLIASERPGPAKAAGTACCRRGTRPRSASLGPACCSGWSSDPAHLERRQASPPGVNWDSWASGEREKKLPAAEERLGPSSSYVSGRRFPGKASPGRLIALQAGDGSTFLKKLEVIGDELASNLLVLCRQRPPRDATRVRWRPYPLDAKLSFAIFKVFLRQAVLSGQAVGYEKADRSGEHGSSTVRHADRRRGEALNSSRF